MDTRLQTALYTLAVATRFTQNGVYNLTDTHFDAFLHQNLPWFLLPDAIHTYTGFESSHFVEIPSNMRSCENASNTNNIEVSWLEYPSARILKILSVKNTDRMLHFFNVRKNQGYFNHSCEIGGKININKFDVKNWQHPHFLPIRCHIIQEFYFNKLLRELIDDSKRSENIFIIRHSGDTIDNSHLAAQIFLFQQLAFLKIVGITYEKTGILLNRDWFESHVLSALTNAYPATIAKDMYSTMFISDSLNNRINKKMFEPMNKEKSMLTFTTYPDNLFDKLYSCTVRENFPEF